MAVKNGWNGAFIDANMLKIIINKLSTREPPAATRALVLMEICLLSSSAYSWLLRVKSTQEGTEAFQVERSSHKESNKEQSQRYA